MLRRCVLALAFGLVLFAGARAQADPIVYSQPTNLFGANASQDDPNGLGNFATVYDDFVLASDTSVTDVHWTGSYFNPPSQGSIQSFTITFWDDSAGQPGSSLLSETIAGTAGETFIGLDFFGDPTYTYSVILSTAFAANAGTRYWLSIVPTLPFPPQWGWEASVAGNGVAYQDFFGDRAQLPGDFAFDLTGTAAVPEPATLTLLGLGLAGFAGRKRIGRLRRS